MKESLLCALKIYGIKILFAIMSVLLSLFFAWLVQFDAGRIVYAAVMYIFYASVCASETWTLAQNDKDANRRVSHLKGAAVAVMLAVIYLAVIGALTAFHVEQGVINFVSAPMSILFKGQTAVIFQSLFILPDMALCIAGYILGVKDINFKEALVFKRKK